MFLLKLVMVADVSGFAEVLILRGYKIRATILLTAGICDSKRQAGDESLIGPTSVHFRLLFLLCYLI